MKGERMAAQLSKPRKLRKNSHSAITLPTQELTEDPKGNLEPLNIPIARLLADRRKGLSYDQLAKLYGCCKATAHNYCKKWGTETLDQFEKQEPTILLAIRQKLINGIDDGVVKGWLERRGMVDYGIIVDKQMQLQGKTNNINDMMINNMILLFGGNAPGNGGNGSSKVGEAIDVADSDQEVQDVIRNSTAQKSITTAEI
jgi:hypothetical protein